MQEFTKPEELDRLWHHTGITLEASRALDLAILLDLCSSRYAFGSLKQGHVEAALEYAAGRMPFPVAYAQVGGRPTKEGYSS